MAPISDDVSEAVRTLRSLPRVVIVSRRTVRKNKFVDFVGKPKVVCTRAYLYVSGESRRILFTMHEWHEYP